MYSIQINVEARTNTELHPEGQEESLKDKKWITCPLRMPLPSHLQLSGFTCYVDLQKEIIA